ncbi:hypothetical protein PR048_005976 [Dryococelus australis]|uniref:Mutator-like transposase domain-containing protein n=1 Tax=Dryococelus australis TaxID=614101 RepID=A0ABQ9I9P5_9NEOP|nr:hypothetical protein PR048_005976 [Dryococelus australis]
MITTGGGYSQLEEFCAALNMPCIARNSCSAYHGQVSESIHQSAWKLMSEAAKEEAELAIEARDIDKDGNPIVTVVADGAWGKRSYKSKYDSLSRVVRYHNLIQDQEATVSWYS